MANYSSEDEHIHAEAASHVCFYLFEAKERRTVGALVRNWYSTHVAQKQRVGGGGVEGGGEWGAGAAID